MKKRFFTNEAGIEMVEITTPDKNSVIRRATDDDRNELPDNQHPGPSIGNSSGHNANMQITPLPEKPIKTENEANDATADPVSKGAVEGSDVKQEKPL